jgi:hypothetical protein
LKVTVPVGLPALRLPARTVVVNVTLLPYVDCDADEVRVVAEGRRRVPALAWWTRTSTARWGADGRLESRLRISRPSKIGRKRVGRFTVKALFCSHVPS